MTNLELCEFLRDSLELWGIDGLVRSIGSTIQISTGDREIAVRRDESRRGPAVWNLQVIPVTAGGSRQSCSVVGLLRNLKALVGAEGDGNSLRIGVARSAAAEFE